MTVCNLLISKGDVKVLNLDVCDHAPYVCLSAHSLIGRWSTQTESVRRNIESHHAW